MLVVENRASVILYNFLRSNFSKGIFLLPANICPIVPSIFLKAGLKFDFVDIDENHAVNKNKSLELISKKHYNGLFFVHAYGRVFDNTVFYADLKKINSNCIIIDDKCLCIPDLSFNTMPNVDLQIFSTGYAKYVELSYGGWGIIDNNFLYNNYLLPYNEIAYATQMNLYKKYFLEYRFYKYVDSNWLNTSKHTFNDNNYFSIIKRQLDTINQHKIKINKIYDTELPDRIKFSNEYNNWRYMIFHENRKKILNKIFDSGYFAGTNFPSVAYMFNMQVMPQAEYEQNVNINLFNDFRVDEIFAHKVCDIINSNL